MEMKLLACVALIVVATGASAQPRWLLTPPEDGTAIFSRGSAGSIPPERNFQIRTIGDFTGGAVQSEILVSLLFPPSESLFTDTIFIMLGENLNRPFVNLGDPFFSRTIRVIGPEGSNFGSAIAPAGDVNRDGFSDYLVGAPFEGTGGRIYVMRGTNYRNDRLFIENPETEEFILMRIDGSPGERFGITLSDGTDISDDGFSDIFIPSPNTINSIDGVFARGAAYILYGTTTIFQTTQVSGEFDLENSLTLTGQAQPEDETVPFFSGFGTHIEPIGDFTGDGVIDVAISGGSSIDPPFTSRIHILPGGERSTGFFRIDQAPVEQIVVDIQLFDSPGEALLSDLTGADLNGDGRSDLVLGFQSADSSPGTSSRGMVAVVFSHEITQPTLTITPNHEHVAILSHWNDEALFGAHLRAIDGVLAVGAPSAQNAFLPQTRPGALYLFDEASIQQARQDTRVGRIASQVIYGATESSLLGQSIDLYPDRDRDGVPELILATGGTEAEAHLVGYLLPAAPIFGDVNGDGVRDKLDLFPLLNPELNSLDGNDDGVVNLLDVLLLRMGFSLY